MRRHFDSILLVHSANQINSELVSCFDEQERFWVGANRFSDAIQMRQQSNFSLVVCDWEFFQTAQENSDESQSIDRLLADSLPLIFISTNQSVAVKFKIIQGRSFYSLRLADCKALFAVIAELTSQVPCEKEPDCLFAQDEAVQHKRLTPQPHFPNQIVIDPGLENSSIHVLY